MSNELANTINFIVGFTDQTRDDREKEGSRDL